MFGRTEDHVRDKQDKKQGNKQVFVDMFLLHVEADHILALMTEQVYSQNYIFDRTVPVTGTLHLLLLYGHSLVR